MKLKLTAKQGQIYAKNIKVFIYFFVAVLATIVIIYFQLLCAPNIIYVANRSFILWNLRYQPSYFWAQIVVRTITDHVFVCTKRKSSFHSQNCNEMFCHRSIMM